MQASELPRAVAAARSTVSELDLAVDDAIVLQDSNRLVLRLMPCDVVARVAPMEYQVSAEFEVELAQRLAETGSPVAALHPRVEPRVHVRDGFVMNMWTFYEPVRPRSPAGRLRVRARAPACRHAAGRSHRRRTSRIESRRLNAWSGAAKLTPALVDADRELLAQHAAKPEASDSTIAVPPSSRCTASRTRGTCSARRKGCVFIDLETCCRGPVEFDLAHVPDAVSEHYRDADQDLLRECRGLTLAMVAAWRWDRDDHYPNGRRAGRELLAALREGPPWPTLDVMSRR